VQAAQLTDELMAGSQVEVISVAEDDGRFQIFPEVALGKPFDGCLGTDWHEDGRGDVAMLGVQNAGTRARHRTFCLKFESNLARNVGQGLILTLAAV
jgi:hypothetical protein